MGFDKTCSNIQLSCEKDIKLYGIDEGNCLNFSCVDANKNGCLRDGECQECLYGFNCSRCNNAT